MRIRPMLVGQKIKDIQIENDSNFTAAQMLKDTPHLFRLGRENDPELLSFYNQVAMANRFFSIYMKRDPRFFALYDQRGGSSLTIGLRDQSNQLIGMGSVLSTPCFVNGQPANFSYLCDLRVNCRDRELRKEWHALFSKFIKDGPRLPELGENSYMVTALLESNLRAKKLIQNQVHAGYKFIPIAPYSMVNVWGKNPFRSQNYSVTRKHEFTVSRGGELEELEAFLQSVHNKQAFGFKFGAPDFILRRNLKTWVDFSLNDFFVVRNSKNKIIATAAPWATDHCKQTLIDCAWWLKPLNTIAKLLGLPLLGQPIRFLYLTHLAFDWDLSPEEKLITFEVLFDSIWPEKKRRNAHVISFADFKDYSLLPSLNRYFKSETKITLYLTVPEARADYFTKESLGLFPPAFEMALV